MSSISPLYASKRNGKKKKNHITNLVKWWTIRAYMSSKTTADAPPPPLHTPATPYRPSFCLKTCQDNTQMGLLSKFCIFNRSVIVFRIHQTKAGTNPEESNKDSCSTATKRMSKWHCPSMNINLFLSPAHTNELLQTSLQNTNFCVCFLPKCMQQVYNVSCCLGSLNKQIIFYNILTGDPRLKDKSRNQVR